MTNRNAEPLMVAGIDATSGGEETAGRAFELIKEIRSLTIATTDDGKPAARIIDFMHSAGHTLYFMTARGKPFYRQLKENPYVAIVGLSKDYYMVRVKGEIRFMEDRSLLEELMVKSPGGGGMYAGRTDILEMFSIEAGCGEIFDLSGSVPKRLPFSFGGKTCEKHIYRITDDCISCGLCLDACPVGATSEGKPYRIDPVLCLHCGRCAETCPEDAIVYSAEE